MFLLIALFLVAQGATPTSDSRWDSPDVLIEDSLGPFVAFAADYNYTTGDIYVACIADSGTYCGPDDWGLLLFRSTDHGESWNLLYCDSNDLYLTRGKEIDLVVTRDDTAYAVISWDDPFMGNDKISVVKFYESGGEWHRDYLSYNAIRGEEISTPKLERDDFSDFYLYMVYIDAVAGNDMFYILRSMDRGYNWDTLAMATGTVEECQDVDMTAADSTLYTLWTWQYYGIQYLALVSWGNRGETFYGSANILSHDTLTHTEMEYPRIGATTTVPDVGQVVYAFYSQENSISGGYDLLYLYHMQHAGWTSDPDTLAKGSSSPILCDLRGYQVAPNKWMDITYCFRTSVPVPSFENFWCWSSESDPTSWQGITSVSTGIINSIPELIYSPGAAGGGGAVVFNDFYGNLWFDAPWYSGIAENPKENEDKTRSEVVLPGSVVKLSSRGAAVYDVMGREVTKLNGDSWDLKDAQGEKVKCGIYFIVNEKTGERVKVVIPIK
jgi:hypothetical protein